MVTVLWWWRRWEERDDFLEKYGIIRSGSVAEWLKAHDSKSCMQQCIGGSNPLASANHKKKPSGLIFMINLIQEKIRTAARQR